MSKSTHQQELNALSSAKNGLLYLTANDWALIVDKAVRRTFKPGEFLVQQARRTHGVFVLLTGAAHVQIPGQEPRQIAPGEVCGEISFIDELPATADVVARDATEALYLDRPTLQSLFELFPHLGSRFYRSMASILSHRLRELIADNSPVLQTSSSSNKTNPQ
ncbi:MAG TPA: cyclic nucleotide-binding domain-containing protein [Candidatus Sulfotelmatobacter sp.]|nr:cyclic nucleotide-binding domain-containing protein [Candidatus Sulfotelmatobacter sp.]